LFYSHIDIDALLFESPQGVVSALRLELAAANECFEHIKCHPVPASVSVERSGNESKKQFNLSADFLAFKHCFAFNLFCSVELSTVLSKKKI
jgi:hypothetical protein